jgi:hypothetical protein
MMGPDLMVWRTNVFEKNAGSPEITWHQGTTFLMEQAYKPAMEPADKRDIAPSASAATSSSSTPASKRIIR